MWCSIFRLFVLYLNSHAFILKVKWLSDSYYKTVTLPTTFCRKKYIVMSIWVPSLFSPVRLRVQFNREKLLHTCFLTTTTKNPLCSWIFTSPALLSDQLGLPSYKYESQFNHCCMHLFHMNNGIYPSYPCIHSKGWHFHIFLPIIHVSLKMDWIAGITQQYTQQHEIARKPHLFSVVLLLLLQCSLESSLITSPKY